MQHTKVKSKIIKHLSGVNSLGRQTSTGNLVKVLSKRYGLCENMVMKSIADWSAGFSAT